MVVFLLLCVLILFYKNFLTIMINYHIYLIYVVLFTALFLATVKLYKNVSVFVIFFYSFFYWSLYFEFLCLNIYVFYFLYDFSYIICITMGVV